MGFLNYITQPLHFKPLQRMAGGFSILKNGENPSEMMLRDQIETLNLTRNVTIDLAGNIAEYRDPETGGHIKRTKRFVKRLALELRRRCREQDPRMDDNYIELLTRSSPLHDIGKVGIPDAILQKPGRLSSEEFSVMKKHTVYGRDIIEMAGKRLGKYSFLNIARDIAFCHHEKWDGSGYPSGLKGTEIPLSGRLMALADVYDALTSRRVYKPAFSHEKAVKIILAGEGTHFDPVIVTAFAACESAFMEISIKFADIKTGHLDFPLDSRWGSVN